MASLGHNELTHRGRDKMATIFQMTFQVHFPEWKCINFHKDFTKVYSQWSNQQYSSISSDNGLAPTRRQAIIWSNDGLSYRCIYAKAKRQWSQVGWMLIHHRDGLLSSSFCFTLNSSVGLWVGIQSAGESVSWDFQVRILHSAEEDNLSPLDSNIACLWQSVEINNNKHVYRQSQVRKPNGSEVKWAECSLIIGTGCWVQVFAWSSIAQLVCEWAFSLLVNRCLETSRFESCTQQRKTTNVSF